jgi:CubicO group peptidase (beta-lactamase class C family)
MEVFWFLSVLNSIYDILSKYKILKGKELFLFVLATFFSDVHFDFSSEVQPEVINKDSIIQIKSDHPDDLAYIVQIEGADIKAVMEEAWKRVDPLFGQKMTESTCLAPMDPFDEFCIQKYRSLEGRVIEAFAHRYKNRVFCLLVNRREISDLQKFLSVFLSLEIEGVQKQNVLGRDLHSIVSDLPKVEQFIEKAIKDFEVPGLTIAVIEDKKLVYSKGFGYRSEGLQMDKNTVMNIASATKPLTSLLLAKLVDEKRFDWTTPIIQLYPKFKHKNLELQNSITMEDLLSMGLLPPKFWCSILNYKEMDSFKILEVTDPIAPKRERFLYNNAQFDVAGRIASGGLEGYKSLMKEKIFEPLGMTRSGFLPIENFAMPHSVLEDGKTHEISLDIDFLKDIITPAGGVWSSVEDLSKYVILELNNGLVDGESFISSKNLLQRRCFYTVRKKESYYGMGLEKQQKDGIQKIGHTGGTLGFSSAVFFYPEKQCGIIILINKGMAHSLIHLIEDKLFEIWFSADEKINKKYEILLKNERDRTEECRKQMAGKEACDYVGSFQNEFLGNVEISKVDGEFIFKSATVESRLAIFLQEDRTKGMIFKDPPMFGVFLSPISKDQFSLEEYVFSRDKS